MSWKTDIAILGGLGVAGYLVITHAKDIGDWIGQQIGGAIGGAAGGIGGGISSGILQPIYLAGQQVGQITREIFYDVPFNLGVQAGQLTQQNIIQPLFNAGEQTAQAIQTAGAFKANIYQALPISQPLVNLSIPAISVLPGLSGLGGLAGLANTIIPQGSPSNISQQQFNTALANIQPTGWISSSIKQQAQAVQPRQYTPTGIPIATQAERAALSPAFIKFVQSKAS